MKRTRKGRVGRERERKRRREKAKKEGMERKGGSVTSESGNKGDNE